ADAVDVLEAHALRRLVEQHQRRRHRERRRDLERALPAIAELDCRQRCVGLEVDRAQQLDRLGVERVERTLGAPELKRRAELSLQRDAHVLEHREMREHGRDLERADDATAGDRRRLLGGDVGAVEDDPARGRRQELGEEVEAGRLTVAVRPDQRVDRAAANAQIDLVDGDEALELLGEIGRLEDEVAAHRSTPAATRTDPPGRSRRGVRTAAGTGGSPPRRSVRRRATSSAASRWRAPRSLPSCALWMQTATPATGRPEASKTGAPNEATP